MERSGKATPRRTPGSNDDFLTPDDLAKLLKVPVETLSSWRAARKGPDHLRLGKHIRYPKPYIDEWLATLDVEARRWKHS